MLTGIEKISARILEEARTAGEEQQKEARIRAEEIRLSYQKEGEALKASLLEKNKADAAESIRRAVSVAELEARKRLLAAKQEMMSKAFSEASARLAALPDEELCRLLSRLASEASQTGGEQIILSPPEHMRIGKKVCTGANGLLKKAGKTAELTLSENPREVPGGGLLLSAGEVETNCSFAALIDSLKTEISGDVAGILF